VAVAARNATVAIVNAKLGSLIAADLPTLIDCIALGVVVAACATCATAFNIPPTGSVRNNVVTVRSSLHVFILAFSNFVIHSMTKPS
jgi:hypothetical protein